MKRISLADVARAAGVGKATASRALSGRDEVGEATRERIIDIAATMGYQPNRTARSLRTGRYDVVALFVRLDLPESGEVLRTAAQFASDAGYQVLVGSLRELGNVGELHSQLDGLAVDAACVVGEHSGATKALSSVSDIPIVFSRTDADSVRATMIELLGRLAGLDAGPRAPRD